MVAIGVAAEGVQRREGVAAQHKRPAVVGGGAVVKVSADDLIAERVAVDFASAGDGKTQPIIGIGAGADLIGAHRAVGRTAQGEHASACRGLKSHHPNEITMRGDHRHGDQ